MEEKTIPISQFPFKNGKPALELKNQWANSFSYRALFEQTSECIFIISLDFHYITANQQALDLLGYEEYELIGKPVGEVVSQLEEQAYSIPEDQQSPLQERICKRKDGTTVPVEISTTIVYDDDHPAYIQSIVRDISVRKKTEKTLKRNTLILSIISEATARLLQSTDFDTKIPFLLQSLGQAFNVSYCTIFTFDTGSGIGDIHIRYSWSGASISNEDCMRLIKSNIPQLLESHSHIYSTVEAKEPNRSDSNLAFVSIPIDGAFVSRGFLCLIDVSENLLWSQSEKDALQTAANLINATLQRKYYEDTIRLNEIRNRVIVDSLPDLIIRVDVNGIILDYSASPNHPLYIHRDLVYGRNLNQTFPEEIVTRIIGNDNQESFGSIKKVNEFRLPYANATYEASLYPICSDEALIIIRDVTEEARLNQMKSDFINRASHELRTPLTSAMLMVELIQEGGTAGEIEECWKTLKSELQRQKELIDRLLIAGRLESGMMKIEANVIDLIPVLQESILAVKSVIAKRNISLAMTCDQTESMIRGDKGGLQQVFINLINNAAKFSLEGNRVEILLTHSDTHAHVAIVDKGIGIPSEDIPHLFERFYRAKNVTVAEVPGSGIGLYIVNSIVKELGGEITVDSILGKGTTFTVTLKRVESA